MGVEIIYKKKDKMRGRDSPANQRQGIELHVAGQSEGSMIVSMSVRFVFLINIVVGVVHVG